VYDRHGWSIRSNPHGFEEHVGTQQEAQALQADHAHEEREVEAS
jgi:hypothetical protein